MRYPFFIIIFILFGGCGVGTTTTSSSSETNTSQTVEVVEDTNVSDETNSSTSVPTNFGGLYNEQWYMEKDTEFYDLHGINIEANIHPTSTTYQTYTGKGIKVAIIDDGFDINHPEIKDNIIATIGVSLSGVVSSNVAHTNSSDFHGTAVAGIIASKDNTTGIRGLAPDSSLILIKMPTQLSDSTIIKMFDEAINAGADVISCSWGTGTVSQTLRDYINGIARTARDGKGVTIVFASGNDDIEIGDDESGIENIIGVGATDGDNLRTSYSNYGALLDIVAPGGNIHSIATIDPLGSNGVTSDEYNRYNQIQNSQAVGFIGTSAAAPIVTGSIALLLEKDPNLTAEQIQEKLKTATDAIGQNTPYIYDMVSSNSQHPTISGIYGTSKLSTFRVKLTLKSSNTTYGPYSVVDGTNNSWDSMVTNMLPNGDYKIELLDNGGITIWATDDNFTIDTTLLSSTINTSIKKSNYYGYGKINLSKLLQ
ncbi:MAG: S8 family serine peptidase [Arcobacteraceae bacterium]|nr:S8 family serine peptidase [Arcobacteraceae bacterium]